MDLMPKYLKKTFSKAPLYSKENCNPTEIKAKYFTPDANWTWYATEFDGDDTFFGYVDGLEGEWGYFSLKELKETRGPWGLKIERDLHFDGVVIDQNGKLNDGPKATEKCK